MHKKIFQIKQPFALKGSRIGHQKHAMDNGNRHTTGAALIGDFSRTDKMRINESALIAQLMGSNRDQRIMVDVGAHIGSALPPFLAKGWKIFAFEPDEKNREILEKRYGDQPNVIIDARAVSDKPAENVQFYNSRESTGISSLSSFHKTHKKAGKVSVTTIGNFCSGKKIEHIDFLLVDAEGHDLFVLRGINWSAIKPEVIVCEFEDRKTNTLGYNFHDMATFLQNRGYEVLVSEWHPILRYGITHDWRRLVRYPCEILNSEAWGNLIAFRKSPDWQKLLSIAARQAMPASENKNVLSKIIMAVWGRISRRLLKIYG